MQMLGPVQQLFSLDPQPQLMNEHATQQWLIQPHLGNPTFLATARTLGWRTHDITRPLLPCARLMSVSAVTRHLSTPLAIVRTAAHTEYIQQAVEPAPRAPDQPQLLRNLQRSLQSVWKLPWEAEYKDTLWRLAVNGIQGAGGAGICFARPCPCGYAMTTYHRHHNHSHLHRLHSFWSCPVAVAIRRQLETQLNTPQLSRSALWLLTPPTPHINTGVWQVVCTAAISAMDLGRRCMWSAYIAAGRPDPNPALPAVTQAATTAVQHFWQLLIQFSDRQTIPAGPAWWGLGSAHPFLAATPPNGQEEQDFHPLSVRLPPAFLLSM